MLGLRINLYKSRFVPIVVDDIEGLPRILGWSFLPMKYLLRWELPRRQNLSGMTFMGHGVSIWLGGADLI